MKYLILIVLFSFNAFATDPEGAVRTWTRPQKIQYIFARFADPVNPSPTPSDRMKGAFQYILINKMQDYSTDQVNPILDLVIETYQAQGGT